MPDPYLEAMMHGEILNKKKNKPPKGGDIPKDRFEIALDKNIRQMVDLIYADIEPIHGQLISPEMQRKKIEADLRESLGSPELSQYLDTAFKTLLNEGKQYLEPENYETMIKEFSKAIEYLDQLDLEKLLSEPLDKVLDIHTETIDSIFKIAIEKYKEEQYNASLALFVLLTILQNEDFDYWYRAGIAAQQCENYTFAIKGYNTAENLNPELIGAYLFATECYLKLDQKSEAKDKFEKAKILAGKSPLDSNWTSVYNYIGSLIK